MKLVHYKSHHSLLQEQLGRVLRNVLFICFFFSFYASVFGQNDRSLIDNEPRLNKLAAGECPMTLGPTELQMIVARDAKRAKEGKAIAKSTVRDVPVKIHIVRQSDGTGGLALASALADIAQANTLFSTAEFNFYQCGDVNYIDNDTYFTEIAYSTSTSSDEHVMANANKVPDALNVFYCPYSTYYGSHTSWASFPFNTTKDWIIMANYQSDNESTFSHEAGHWFDLYHTHQGSETVTRVPGSSCFNCDVAGDLLCDTPADIAYGFTSSCTYIGTQTNACDGLAYAPLTDNVMSYAHKPCRINFTSEQINRMQVSYDFDRTSIHNPTSCTAICTTDAYEPNNSSSTADYLGSSTSYTRNNLCITLNDNDYFRVKAYGKNYYIRIKGNGSAVGEYKLLYSRSGINMTFETASENGSTTDTYILLYSSNGTSLLAANNNGGSGLFSKITYTIPPCTPPTATHNYTNNITGSSARLNCTAPGIYRDFQYKASGASSWTPVQHTTGNIRTITGLSPNTTYYWKSRAYCGPWSVWSSTEVFTTASCTPAVATASEIDNSQNVYCDYAYGICQGHTGDFKQFQLKNLTTNAVTWHTTTSHYVYFPSLTESTTYRYRVRMKCGTTGGYGGWSVYEYFTTTVCLVGDTGNSLTADVSNSKVKYSLVGDAPDIRNYPNPFNGQTTIEFDLVDDAAVTLFISDVTGKKIQVLLDHEQRSRGINQVMFEGNNHPAGIYYYTMSAGEHVITRKMILIK